MADETYNFRGNLCIEVKEGCNKDIFEKIIDEIEEVVECDISDVDNCCAYIEIDMWYRSCLDDIEAIAREHNVIISLDGEEMDLEYERDWNNVEYTFK